MPASGNGWERDDLESFIHVSSRRSIEVKCFGSFEYILNWKAQMYLQRSYRASKSSEGSPRGILPGPNKQAAQRRSRAMRRSAAPGEHETDDNVVTTHGEQFRDLIDVINGINGDKRTAEEDGESVQVVDEGVENCDDCEDCCSVNSSIVSGPCLQHSTAATTPRASQDVCPACWKLYKRAKKMKAPVLPKLLDSDPKSLNCDQWVLMKNRRSRRSPTVRGKLLNCVQLAKKRLKGKNDAELNGPRMEEDGLSGCSRPHPFLQRNLRLCVGVSVRKEGKKNRRKRTREDSQGPRVAKQKRLHSSNGHQHGSTDGLATSGQRTTLSHEARNGQQMGDGAEADPAVELSPFDVASEQTPEPKQKAPKTTRGFRDLLSQMRGNNSMIVRETC